MKKYTRKTAALLMAGMMVLSLAACGGARPTRTDVSESDLIGSWYDTGTGRLVFELGEDGRSESYDFGPRCPGDWSLQDGLLQIDALTGEQEFFADSPKDGCLVLTDLYGHTTTLWDSEERAIDAEPVDDLAGNRQIVGSWGFDFPFAETFNAAMVGTNDELSEYISFKNIDVPMVMTFFEDGRMVLRRQETDMERTAKELGKQYLDCMDRVIDAMKSGELDPSGDPLGLAGYMIVMGHLTGDVVADYEAVIEDMTGSEGWEMELLESLVPDEVLSGNYIYRSGDLYVGSSGGEVRVDHPFSVSISGKKLTMSCDWDDTEGDGIDQVMKDIVEDIVFVRSADADSDIMDP